MEHVKPLKPHCIEVILVFDRIKDITLCAQH